MKKYFLFFIFTIFLNYNFLFAQDEIKEHSLSGSLNIDSKLKFNYSSQTNKIYFYSEKEKSPVKAGILSLILPGAGEFYSKSYWKTALFIAIEVGTIAGAVIYDNKGDDQTTKYQNYADGNWSVVKYAEYLNSNGADIPINPDESLPPWERVNFNVLNEFETGSHKLPPHGDQQYYELIGKYHQYSPGWNDYPIGNSNLEPSPNFLSYSLMRGKANDYYSNSDTFVKLTVVNHFLSAFDAFFTANKFNKKIAMNVRMNSFYYENQLTMYPTVNVKYNF